MATRKQLSRDNFLHMLADPFEPAKAKFPYDGSYKIDGVRAGVIDGNLRSRKLKPFANKHVQRILSNPIYNGLDGELVMGSPTAEDCMRVSDSAITTIKGEPYMTWYVFDDFTDPDLPARERKARAKERVQHFDDLEIRIVFLDTTPIPDMAALEAFKERALKLGYEGVMLNHPEGLYKYGRSTMVENLLLKVKPKDRFEMIVTGTVEEMKNNNVAKVDERGYTKRSTHKANKVGKGRIGKLLGRALNGPFHGMKGIRVGSGLTAADKELGPEYWIGKIVVVEYVPVGIKDKPRHPTFKGERKADISTK